MSYADSRRRRWLAAFVLLVVTIVALQTFAPFVVELMVIVADASYVQSVLRLAVPIAFAALGGIFAEKSGVINIGLEGLLIVSAFGAAGVTHTTGSIWIGLFA